MVWTSVKVPVIVSCSISFSSYEFVIGRLLFVLVFHVGLFVFAFLSRSQNCLKFSKVTKIHTKTCLQFCSIVDEPSRLKLEEKRREEKRREEKRREEKRREEKRREEKRREVVARGSQ